MPLQSEPNRTRRHRGFSTIELLIVTLILLVVAAMAIPKYLTIVRNMRIAGDARGIADQIALAKMRAASKFTQARLYVDLRANTYHIEYWQKTGAPGWVAEGGTQFLSPGVTLGFGSLNSAPPNTQTTIAQAPACLVSNTGTATIANTACLQFNSRGIPIDSTWAPTPIDAIYVTDGVAVYGATVSAMGLIQTWRSGVSTAAWWKQ